MKSFSSLQSFHFLSLAQLISYTLLRFEATNFVFIFVFSYDVSFLLTTRHEWEIEWRKKKVCFSGLLVCTNCSHFNNQKVCFREVREMLFERKIVWEKFRIGIQRHFIFLYSFPLPISYQLPVLWSLSASYIGFLLCLIRSLPFHPFPSHWHVMSSMLRTIFFPAQVPSWIMGWYANKGTFIADREMCIEQRDYGKSSIAHSHDKPVTVSHMLYHVSTFLPILEGGH